LIIKNNFYNLTEKLTIHHLDGGLTSAGLLRLRILFAQNISLGVVASLQTNWEIPHKNVFTFDCTDELRLRRK